MNIRNLVIKSLKIFYRKVTKKKFLNPVCDLDRQSANNKIFNLLSSDKPCMITRYGSNEIGTVLNYICIYDKETSYLKKIYNYIKDYTELPWWDDAHLKPMEEVAGVFNISFDLCERLSVRYIEDSKHIDMIGSFHYTEKFMPMKEDVIKIHLETMYPFFVEHPWTKALAGKKVLVVHPFASSIKRQYENRHLLFENKEILPDFDLKVFASVLSLAGENVPFIDWFDALRYMENEIKKIDFDICILGCGAYGLPLAGFIKRMGKKAIHMGGGVQLLFGIKGSRWEDGKYKWTYKTPIALDVNYQALYNDFWVRASPDERPKAVEKVEGGCYW